VKQIIYTVFAGCLIALAGCEHVVKETDEEQDSGPDRPYDVSHIPEPVPRKELRTIAGNHTPYRVLGKTYHVIQSPEGYAEKGRASWYGKKFHGRKTSNGELYNMYGMTAAHKTLPIPSYVRVTNQNNRASIIVRVNDRGPFHGDRIIDLTYTAAKKLGFQNQGTAEVLVEYIDPDTYQGRSSSEPSVLSSGSSEPPAPTPGNAAGYALPPNTFLQVGAFGDAKAAKAFKRRLMGMTTHPVEVLSPGRKVKTHLYRVQVGPFSDNLQLSKLREKLIAEKLPAPHLIYR